MKEANRSISLGGMAWLEAPAHLQQFFDGLRGQLYLVSFRVASLNLDARSVAARVVSLRVHSAKGIEILLEELFSLCEVFTLSRSVKKPVHLGRVIVPIMRHQYLLHGIY